MRILGIDPGTALTGFGVIDSTASGIKLVDFGVIRTPARTRPEKRLQMIYEGFCELVNKHSPDSVAIEQLFFNTNTRTALSVGESRGVIFLASSSKHLPVEQYTPLQVKQAVVGYGRATKEQVQYMVKGLLAMTKIPKPDDAADALAIAICHANSAGLAGLTK